MKLNGEIPVRDLPIAATLVLLLFFVSGLKDAVMMVLIIGMMIVYKPYRQKVIT